MGEPIKVEPVVIKYNVPFVPLDLPKPDAKTESGESYNNYPHAKCTPTMVGENVAVYEVGLDSPEQKFRVNVDNVDIPILVGEKSGDEWKVNDIRANTDLPGFMVDSEQMCRKKEMSPNLQKYVPGVEDDAVINFRSVIYDRPDGGYGFYLIRVSNKNATDNNPVVEKVFVLPIKYISDPASK